MAGVKRRTSYRKTVTDDVLYGVPELPEGHRVAVLLRSHGGNLLEVRTDAGDEGIALLPTKYRKLIWIKRGDYLVVSEATGAIHTAGGGQGTVRFLIEAVLYPDAIKALQRLGKWPAAFAAGVAGAAAARGRALPPGEGDGDGGGGAAAGSSAGNRSLRHTGQHRRGMSPSDDEGRGDDDGDGDGGGDNGGGDGAGAAVGNDEDAEEEVTDSHGNTVVRRRMSAGGGAAGDGTGAAAAPAAGLG